MSTDAQQDAREKLLRKAAVVKRVLQTPEGRELLEILRQEFFVRLEGKDETQIVFNAGRADVVAYLMQLEKVTE